MMSSKKFRVSSIEKPLSLEEQQSKIEEVKKVLGPLCERFPYFCSDASISRYLGARNWNPKKASKMLKDTIKWRLEYKPENIRWEDVAQEGETGKMYKANYLDKHERTVLVVRPGFQNSKSTKGQIRYLVYCLENAIMNLTPDQEQMVWLIDFQNWNTSTISVMVTRETAHVLQDYYPERLGLAILYNPPKVFESFWKIVKPLLDKKTFKKVRFVYSDNPESQKIMEDLFDMDKLECAFGGRNLIGFDYKEYGERMTEDDRRNFANLNSDALMHSNLTSVASVLERSEILISPDAGSEASDEASSSGGPPSPNAEAVENSLVEKIGSHICNEVGEKNAEMAKTVGN